MLPCFYHPFLISALPWSEGLAPVPSLPSSPGAIFPSASSPGDFSLQFSIANLGRDLSIDSALSGRGYCLLWFCSCSWRRCFLVVHGFVNLSGGRSGGARGWPVGEMIVGSGTSFSSSEVCGISFLACLTWIVPSDFIVQWTQYLPSLLRFVELISSGQNVVAS